MTHSTHFILRKEGKVLFNDTLNTFYFTEGRKGFYLMTHSTHFIYGRKEGKVLFNDALNTFYFTEGRKGFI